MPLDSEQINDLINQVDESRLVSSLANLVSIPSVNPFDDPVTKSCREFEVANAYEAYLNDVGLTTWRRDVVDGRPNVFGKMENNLDGHCLMFAGHLDTVGIDGYQDPFNPIIENGKLYGRGSCDMKAGLAAYLEVARIISESDVKLKGQLLVVGVADEEHKMIGSKEISENGPIPDFAIIGEPTELKVCHAHKGQLCMHIKTFGKAGHSSAPEKGVNAIAHMADVVKAIEMYGEELMSRNADLVCGHGRVNPGVIKGGTISSSVPDYCELEVDRRLIVGEDLNSVVNEYKNFLDPLVKNNSNFKYEISEPTLNNPALDTPVDSKVVTTIADAIQSEQGRSADIGALGAATDAPNYLCPAVVCGPGSINQAHTLDEYVEIDQVTAAARIYLRTALELLS